MGWILVERSEWALVLQMSCLVVMALGKNTTDMLMSIRLLHCDAELVCRSAKSGGNKCRLICKYPLSYLFAFYTIFIVALARSAPHLIRRKCDKIQRCHHLHAYQQEVS